MFNLRDLNFMLAVTQSTASTAQHLKAPRIMAATADCVYPASVSNCIHGLHVRDSIQVVCFRVLNLSIILSA